MAMKTSNLATVLLVCHKFLIDTNKQKSVFGQFW